MTKTTYKSNKNIDYLELVFEWDPQQIFELNENKNLIVNGSHNPRTNKWTYDINGIFTITEAPPKGIIEGRTYVKILNPRLYGGKLFETIKFIQSILTIKFLSINRIDFCLDIKDEDIFKNIDFNNLNEYKTSKGIFLCSEANDEEGKSLYFNTIDLNKQKRKSIFKKQRVSAILYTKSNLLERCSNKSKQHYQNENEDLLTRLELRLNKTPQETKDTHLIKTLSYYLWNDPTYLKNHQEIIIQYIFNQYGNIYDLQRGGDPILNYSNLYDDDFDFIYISDFITDFMNMRTDFNIKHKEYKKSKPKTTYSKKIYKEKLDALVKLGGTKWINYINPIIVENILKESCIKWTIELEYIKIHDGETIDGRNIFREIHEYITIQSRTLLNNPPDKYELKLDDDFEGLFE